MKMKIYLIYSNHRIIKFLCRISWDIAFKAFETAYQIHIKSACSITYVGGDIFFLLDAGNKCVRAIFV